MKTDGEKYSYYHSVCMLLQKILRVMLFGILCLCVFLDNHIWKPFSPPLPSAGEAFWLSKLVSVMSP